MTGTAPIPSELEQITAEWMSMALGTKVDAVALTSVGTGQTGATYRAEVAYAGADRHPERFVVKLPARDPQVRQRVAPGYRVECGFYRTVADAVAVPLPYCFHVDVNADGSAFVLVMSDLAPAQQGDQLTGCSPVTASAAVRALAGLHGPTWCDPHWSSRTDVAFPMPTPESAAGLGELTRIAVQQTIDLLGDGLANADQQTLLQAAEVIEPWLLLEPDTFSLLHADYRLDNLMLGPEDGSVTVIDWQTLSVGLPARDLAYFIVTSLLPNARRAAERDLVREYHAALCRYGVSNYDLHRCWRHYRLGVLHVAMLTCLGFAFATGTERGDTMVLAMLSRGCEALRDLDTLEAIRR